MGIDTRTEFNRRLAQRTAAAADAKTNPQTAALAGLTLLRENTLGQIIGAQFYGGVVIAEVHWPTANAWQYGHSVEMFRQPLDDDLNPEFDDHYRPTDWIWAGSYEADAHAVDSRIRTVMDDAVRYGWCVAEEPVAA